jgi:hypothetical protein
MTGRMDGWMMGQMDEMMLHDVLSVCNMRSTKLGCFRSCSSCFQYEIHQTGMLQIMFFVSLESSRRGGVHR